MIHSIQLRDFRGIQQGHIKGFRQLNLLIGPNNSGKSTLMEALYLTGTAGRPATLQAQYGQPITYDVTVATGDLSGNHPQTRLWQRHNFAGTQPDLGQWSNGVLYYTLQDTSIAFSNFDLVASKRNFSPGEEQTTALFAINPPPTLPPQNGDGDSSQDDPHPLLAEHLLGNPIDPFQEARLLFLWSPELTYHYKGTAAWLARGQMPTPTTTFLFDAGMVQNHIPLPFYERMFKSIPGWGQQIGRHFGRIFELNTPFTVQFLPVNTTPQQVQGWIAPNDKPAVPIDAFGDGSRAAFKFLTYLTAMLAKATPTSPGLLLWEEPESFQNPKTLSRLLGEVIQMIAGKPIQLFIASHNLELLAHLANLLQEGQFDPAQTLVFRLELQNGELKSTWFDHEMLQSLLHEGFDPRVWGDFALPLKFSLLED